MAAFLPPTESLAIFFCFDCLYVAMYGFKFPNIFQGSACLLRKMNPCTKERQGQRKGWRARKRQRQGRKRCCSQHNSWTPCPFGWRSPHDAPHGSHAWHGTWWHDAAWGDAWHAANHACHVPLSTWGSQARHGPNARPPPLSASGAATCHAASCHAPRAPFDVTDAGTGASSG